MKKGLLLFCLCCIRLCVQAQVEFTIPYSDSTKSLDNITHIVDKEGNVYVLSTVSDFYQGPGFLIEGTFIHGSSVLKIDKDNNISWQYLYPTSFIAGINSDGPFPESPQQMFIWNGNLAIPYNVYMGNRLCTIDTSLSGVSYAPTYRNAMLVVNGKGDIVTNRIFDEDTDCGKFFLDYTTCNAGTSPFTFIYSDDNYKTTINKRDPSFGSVSMTIADSLSVSNYNFTYDSFANNYITYDNYDVHVYDTSGVLIKAIPLPQAMQGSEILCWKIAFNKNYYVLNYSVYNNNPYYATAILSKEGELISLASSKLFSDIKVTDDNKIWTLAENFDLDSSNLKPVLFMQMDLYQNILRKKNVGMPFTYGAAISIDNNNVVITGSHSYVVNSQTDSFSAPDQLYFYREAITNIPLLQDTSSSCNEINVYPNPATHTLHIVSNNFNVTYGSTVVLYNTLGQKLGTYKWDLKELDIDVSWLSKGMYYIQAMNGTNKICTQKIVKL